MPAPRSISIRTRKKLKKLVSQPSRFFVDSLLIKDFMQRRKGRFPRRLYDPQAHRRSAEALDATRANFLYVPWIRGHGDAVIHALQKADAECNFVPFSPFRATNIARTRSAINRFARSRPDEYRALMVEQLAHLKGRLAAMILTFDWHPSMRVLASVCAELQIPRILVPHESVFMDRDLYYVDASSFVNTPAADEVLCWGELQRDIFAERGYPKERCTVVGTPKFDDLLDYVPEVARDRYFGALKLVSTRQTLLFAAQPMDIQVDTHVARSAQEQAIRDLLDYAETHDVNLIVRLPPSSKRLFTFPLRRRLKASPNAAIDGSQSEGFSAHDAIHHADVTISVNSTMLFEAGLMGKPSLSARYFDFTQLWAPLELPVATGKDSLWEHLDSLLRQPGSTFSQSGWDWAARNFASGHFDGKAAQRICTRLKELARHPCPIANVAKRLALGQQPVKVVGLAHQNRLKDTQLHLLALLGAERAVTLSDAQTAYVSEVFCQWGATPTQAKVRAGEWARRLGRPTLFLEDGFIRSRGIGLTLEPALSVILDDLGLYYDARQPSRLESLLQDGPSLSQEQKARSERAVKMLVASRISKYNDAPHILPDVGRAGRRKILVIDQRAGDASIACGLASDGTFLEMLDAACRENPDADVVVKRHPDATKGGKQSHYADSLASEQVFLLDADVNPYVLLEAVDAVYVVTSGMGFEAAMAGKTVHCFGTPFYAGWGITRDRRTCSRRTRGRDVFDVFHFAYVVLSRYYLPPSGRACEVEDLIGFMAATATSSLD